MDLSKKIEVVNDQLRAGLVGLIVRQQGNKLHLRRILPPKPDSSKIEPHQQRIFLGLPANPSGLKTAEKEARLAGAQLASREFDWRRYIKVKADSPKRCDEWIEKFEYWYLNAKGGTRTTWQGDYIKGLRHLPPGAELLLATMEAAILKTKPNTKNSKRHHQRVYDLLLKREERPIPP